MAAADGGDRQVVHTAAGFVREYLLMRVDDSALVTRLIDELEQADLA